jgi:cytochrome c oxidase cbb3-type subunit 3
MTDTKRHDPIAGQIVHVYDGIEEADNALPNWWLAVFIGTILFAAAYWVVFQQLHLAASPAEALAATMAEQRKREGKLDDSDLIAASKNPQEVAAGKLVYTTTCLVCHGDKAQGVIGPNLTDAYWLHGGSPTQIMSVVQTGVPAKGMPTWGPVLGPVKIKSVVAYVLTLRNTAVAGKPAQGEPWTGP